MVHTEPGTWPIVCRIGYLQRRSERVEPTANPGPEPGLLWTNLVHLVFSLGLSRFPGRMRMRMMGKNTWVTSHGLALWKWLSLLDRNECHPKFPSLQKRPLEKRESVSRFDRVLQFLRISQLLYTKQQRDVWGMYISLKPPQTSRV